MTDSSTPTTATPNASSTDSLRRWACGVMIVVAVVWNGTRIANLNSWYPAQGVPEFRPPVVPMSSANDRSRWCTVWSLAERGTYRIDEIIQVPGWDTIDKVYVDGHFYSTKPALLPTASAGVYWCLKKLTGWSLLTHPHETIRSILFIVNGIPFLVGLLVVFRITERYGRSDLGRVFVVATACFGTFLSPFIVTLNNHSAAAATCVIALCYLLSIAVDGQRTVWNVLSVGFWSMLTAANELPAGLLVPLSAWVIGRAVVLNSTPPGRTPAVIRAAVWFVAGVLPVLVVMLGLNWIVTGSLQPIYAGYGGPTYRYILDGVPSYWMNPSGIDGNRDSPLVYFINCTVGHHGIFSLTPVWVFLIPAWFGLLRRVKGGRQTHPLQPLVGWSLGLTVVLLAFYLSRTENYNYGGNTSGLRWTFWLTPVWLLALQAAIDRISNKTWVPWIAGAALAVSVHSVANPNLNPWRPPWLQTWFEKWGWSDYRTFIAPFDRPRKSWLGPIPESTENDPSPWCELTSVGATEEKLRVQLAGPIVERVATLTVTISGNAATQTLEIPIDAASFNAGESMADTVRGPENQRSRDIAFLQGLSRVNEYRAGRVEYLKTPLRKEAFRCVRAAAQCRVVDPASGREVMHRRDVWVCPDVPFGVVQFDDSVTDVVDNTVYRRQRWLLTGASRVAAYIAPVAAEE